MSDTDDERELRVRLMRSDLNLKDKQAFWETPRNLVIVIGTISAALAAVGGLVGYKIGSQPPPPAPLPPQVIFQPGSIVVQLPTPLPQPSAPPTPK